VTRFCRALGLPGYAEFRLQLATEAGRAEARTWTKGLSATINPRDPLDRVLTSLVDVDTRAIEETAAQLDVAAVKQAVALLAKARKIDIYAVSGSAVIGIDLQLRLHHIGRAAFFWQDVHDALSSAALLGRGDVALAVSHTGQTRETVEALRTAHATGAKTVAVTNFPRSPLAEVADITLTTAARETPFRAGAMSARHAQMLILDCVYIGVAQRTYAATTAALAATSDAVRDHQQRQ
jgi:DNA-binding MurR/RpiR family transcriptional regulator